MIISVFCCVVVLKNNQIEVYIIYFYKVLTYLVSVYQWNMQVVDDEQRNWKCWYSGKKAGVTSMLVFWFVNFVKMEREKEIVLF